MFSRYLDFVRRVSVNRLGKLGVILTTSSFITLIILELARIAGILTNAYVGLITYMLFPALFIIGLILIPLGWYQLKKETGKTTRELLDQKFAGDQLKGGLFGSQLVRTVVILTLVNALFMSVVSIQMLSFMDEPSFCGTACHSVMNPEWVTFQQSPHARVRCVDCHVGEGVGNLIDSKLNGIWQMVSVTFDLLERPIPTPVRQLRPARQTCEKCHWPEKFYGTNLKTITTYGNDSLSTPSYTTLALKIDAVGAGKKAGIHWHIAPENEVRYRSVADEREEMIWVEARHSDGSYVRYQNRSLSHLEDHELETRTLDCVDCHNRATHIYEDPSRGIDRRLNSQLLDRSLPFFKREALHAVAGSYQSIDQAREGIRDQLHSFYRRHYPQVTRTKSALIDSVAEILGSMWARNVHPGMNIKWGSYQSHIGHEGESGCFRCHNRNLVNTEGANISDDCTLCHSILAQESDQPFRYLEQPDSTAIDYDVHRYLKAEFMEFMSQ